MQKTPEWLLRDVLEVAEINTAAVPAPGHNLVKQKMAVFFLEDTEVDTCGKDKQHLARAGLYEGRVQQVRACTCTCKRLQSMREIDFAVHWAFAESRLCMQHTRVCNCQQHADGR